MSTIRSRLTLLSGSAIVVVGATAAVAMAATGGDGSQPAPAPVAVPAKVVVSVPAPAEAGAVTAATVTRIAPAKPAANSAASRAIAVKAAAEARQPTVAMAAPPAGVKVEMPVLRARVRIAGTNHDEQGVPFGGRPQMRLAMSDAQTQPYWDRYNACLHEHGVPLYRGRGLSPVQKYRDPAAEQACEGLMPRMPIAIDRDRNPNFAQDLVNEIACINAHGDPVVADPAGGFWTYRDPQNARERQLSSLAGEPERHAIERACELEAFGKIDR